MSRTEARFSTYSGAPSLQPSLAPTYDSTPTANSARNSQQPNTTTRSSDYLNEKSAALPYSPSTSTLNSMGDPKAADIRNWSGALERMQDQRLEKQRYTMSSNKSEEVSKLALGAKVERALSRRMSGQDAVFSSAAAMERKKRMAERKEVAAN